MSINNGDMPISPINPPGAIFNGLTKREHFAALAMQGILATGSSHTEGAARKAVIAADNLLKELEK